MQIITLRLTALQRILQATFEMRVTCGLQRETRIYGNYLTIFFQLPFTQTY